VERTEREKRQKITKEEKRKAKTRKKAKKEETKTRRPRRGKRGMRECVCVDKGENGEQILGLLCANREGERERQDTRRRLSRFPFPISSFYSSPNGLGQQKNAQKPKSQERKTEPKKAGRPSNKACVTRGGDRRNISI
jgi:hypothetical protein